MLLRRVRDSPRDTESVRRVAVASGHGTGPDGERTRAGRGQGPRDTGDGPARRATPPPGPRTDTGPGAGSGGPADHASTDEADSPVAAVRHRRATEHLVRTDPDGCWLAEDGTGRTVGAVRASLREGTWALSLLVVRPEARGSGVGGALLDRAMAYGRGTLRGIVRGTGDPVAARLLRHAGFALHPTLRLSGPLDPSGLPTPDGPAVEGGAGQRDLMDSVDRAVRGGAHGPDHDELLLHHRVVVADDLAGSGYCYVAEDGRVELLAATSRRIASRLLTAALLSLPAGTAVTVDQLTADQQWALDVGLAAGLRVTGSGVVGLRGMRPPTPYVPSAAFL
ncbi:GNAT family N-acetyltransferase [Streptomyces spiramenti]|uniref:GNAT family N-acetyltransferase n=1 Tax=Streptomyces spiramenti TaxID=2720606 RepID=A0ABX1AMI2_9ACTN|nr:GNAT family N-acetyltransferase [Streptomyces spiramenti]NJP65577.1 GNAT family N-acetyltransferase [Streptomyces spiramenti]